MASNLLMSSPIGSYDTLLSLLLLHFVCLLAFERGFSPGWPGISYVEQARLT